MKFNLRSASARCIAEVEMGLALPDGRQPALSLSFRNRLPSRASPTSAAGRIEASRSKGLELSDYRLRLAPGNATGQMSMEFADYPRGRDPKQIWVASPGRTTMVVHMPVGC